MFSTNILQKFALPLSESMRISLIVSSVLQAVLSIIAIFGNIAVLSVYLKKTRRQLKVSSLFVLNLAISDLLVGLVVLPLMILTNILILYENVLFLRAVLESIMLPFLSTVSIWTIFGSTLDRFVAMYYPTDYTTTVTKFRVTIYILLSWFYSSSWTWFPFLPGVVGKYLLMVRSFIGFLVIIAIIFLWLAIYFKLRQRRKINITGESQARPNLKMWYMVERKVAKIFFCVTVILFVCFVPLWIRAVGHFFGGLTDYSFEVFAITMNLSNGSFNPVVYSFTSRVFRDELLGRKIN